jgi:hypothetical protein
VENLKTKKIVLGVDNSAVVFVRSLCLSFYLPVAGVLMQTIHSMIANNSNLRAVLNIVQELSSILWNSLSGSNKRLSGFSFQIKGR